MPAHQTSNPGTPDALVSMRETVTRLFNDYIAGRDLSEADWWDLIDEVCSARQAERHLHLRRAGHGGQCHHRRAGPAGHADRLLLLPRGQQRQERKANGITVDYTYTLDGLQASHVEKKSDTTTLVSQHFLDYDPNGQKIREPTRPERRQPVDVSGWDPRVHLRPPATASAR
jgi:hypothetical protein